PADYSGSTPVDFKRNSTRTPPETRCPDGSPRTQGQPCPEKKKDEMPQMGAPPGGDEGKGSDKGSAEKTPSSDKGAGGQASSGAGREGSAQAPSSSGETPGQKLSGAEGCSSPKGLRDDSERETKSGDKLGKFKNGLQPGDGTAQAPKSSEDPSGYESELGKAGDCRPKSTLGGPAASARGQIQSSLADFSTPPPPLIGEGIRLKRAYKLAENAGGLVGASAAAAAVKMDSTIAGIHQSLTRLHQSAQALGQAGVESAAKVDEAIAKADGAQTQVKDAHGQLKSQISLAKSAHGQYGGFESGFNACPPMPPADPQGTLCKQPHFGGATTSKSGYVPDPAQRAAESAKREVDGAKAAFDAADRQLRATEEAKQRFKAALQDAQQRVSGFGTGTLELQKAQTGDGNADLRIAELRAMLASFSRYIAEKKAAYDARFHPGSDTLGSARDQLGVMLEGRK
ncbi:MAG: hypothetical protein AAB339_08085, partial [Elusimicrobiota bacterium]